MLITLQFFVHIITIVISIVAPVIAVRAIITFILNKKYMKTEYYTQTHVPYVWLWRDKGKMGEYYIYKNLKPLAGYKKFLFNCYLSKDDGTLTELDVVLLHESGIYIFESKNYSGWIFGAENQQQWTQTLPTGRGKSHKERFLNPIVQNKVHLKWLQEFLREEQPLPMFSYIIFSDHCTLKDITLTSQDHRVINQHDILASVQQNIVCVGKALTVQDIDDLYNRLYPLTQMSEEDKLKHIENIQRKYRPTYEENICPRCGGKLILRTAAKGGQTGKSFWGCSNYPKCRYIKNIVS